jgi:protein-tyrosine phosphatase
VYDKRSGKVLTHTHFPSAAYPAGPLRGRQANYFIENGRKEFSGNIAMNGIDSVRHVPAAHAEPDPGAAGIVVLCTANVCRSPMAAALLARRLAALGVTVPVRSAGMIGGGDPLCPEVISVLASYGIEIASHRSRIVCAADLAPASLVLAMARDHLRYAVITNPEAWPRAFTLKELVRRGERIGPRSLGEPLARWLSRAHAGRERTSLLGDSLDDDVADPAGGPLRAYADTAGLLDRLATRLAELGWAHAEPPS